jgi:hypothetical protein
VLVNTFDVVVGVQGSVFVSASCEHMFVTSQGSPYARLRRALATGNPTIAWAAAAELPSVELADALALCLLAASDTGVRPRDGRPAIAQNSAA